MASMYSIGEAARITGISTYTLRYYEKIGVLPKAERNGAARVYQENDLQYIRFIHGLKETGMNLEEIAAFTESGCLLTIDPQTADIEALLKNRIRFLQAHIQNLDSQMMELEKIKTAAQEKMNYYTNQLRFAAKS